MMSYHIPASLSQTAVASTQPAHPSINIVSEIPEAPFDNTVSV